MKTNKEKVIEVLTSLETGDQTPVSYINHNKYIQHNLAVKDGLAGFGELLQNKPEGGFKAKVIRAFEDGDYVFAHTEYDFFGPKIGFDVFRFEEGLIVEHWDNLVDKTAPNPSGHTQTDGSLELTDLHETENNKKIVEDFVEAILIKGEMDKSDKFFDGENYTQHNSQIGDGLSGLGKAIEEMIKNGTPMIYSKLHKVLGEGNFVLTIGEGKFAGNKTSFYDLFRIENGKIVEHWDTIENILPEEKWQNKNGKFNF